MKIGQKVQLRPSYAKWHLENPEIYFNTAGNCYGQYDAEMLLHLMCCFGVPIEGQVDGHGSEGCFHVVWKCVRVSASYYVERKHVWLK